MTGCCAKGTPAVATEDGCGWITSLLAAPGTSLKRPKGELVETPATFAVPVTFKLPLAKGVPLVGRTRTFCQVSPQVMPLALLLLTVKTNCVLVMEVIAAADPLEMPLRLLALLPLPVKRVMRTFGAVPPVSNLNPAGAFRIMVPVPTLLLAFSA